MSSSILKTIFEGYDASGYLTLKKTELDEQNFIKLLSIKPSEINILLARVVSLIKEETPDGKTKKDLINDILEVLERSSTARQFVGLGALEQYKLFKGFPVRKGDPYESMPEPGEELVLKPSDVYISWSTDGKFAREKAIEYDSAKGDPIGGLMVEVHVDVAKILFDVNALLRTVKSKYQVILKYNAQAAPGKSLSKTNTEYLATQAPLYHGAYEIVSLNQVTTVRVVDKWVWDTNGGNKKIEWVGGGQKKEVELQQKNTEKENTEVEPSDQTAHPQNTPIKETIHNLFEADEHVFNEIDKMHIFEDVFDEGAWQSMKNFLAKSFGTLRGKKIEFVNHVIKFYELERQVYSIAKEYASNVDMDDQRAKLSDKKIAQTEKRIDELKTILKDIETGINVDDIPSVGAEKTDMSGVDPNSPTAKAEKDRQDLENPQQQDATAETNKDLEDLLIPHKPRKAAE